MEKYLVLFSDTFLWFNKNEGILYNCTSTSLLNFKCNALIYECCTELNNAINLYSIKINEQNENDELFQLWINDIVSLNIGRIHTTKNSSEKMIGFPPILNLCNEIEDRESNMQSYTDKIDPSACIREISLFLGGNGEKNDLHKQVLYPFNYDGYISYDAIEFFLKANNANHIQKINIVCSDITGYTDLNKLIELFELRNTSINYYIPDNQIESIEKIFGLSKEENFIFNFYFSSIYNFEKISSIMDEQEIKHNWIFIIDNEEKLNIYDDICQKFNINNFEFWPVITDVNEPFFRENVFTDISDIEEKKYTKRKIFCNQAINSNFWGILFILPTGEIYDNLNFEPLGTLQEDIMKIVSKKITQGEISWKLTRERVKPCEECNYKYLCPPPSNYEFYSDKFDMCFREASQ